MLRSDFDKLKIIDQVEYINNKLNEGETITNICNSIGIGRTTIRDRFKSISYEYNKTTKQYESFIEVIESKNVLNEICMTVERVEQKSNSSNKVVGATLDNNKVLEDLILNYDDMNNKLNKVYYWYLKSSNEVVDKEVIIDNKLNIEDFEGDLVTRSYKLYEPIQKEFADFCKGNKYKVQDILCQFIKEGLEKYN